MAEYRGQIQGLTWGGYTDDNGEFVEDGHNRITIRTDDDIRGTSLEPVVIFTGDSLAAHEAALRERIAREVEADKFEWDGSPVASDEVAFNEGLRHAARIIREGVTK